MIRLVLVLLLIGTFLAIRYLPWWAIIVPPCVIALVVYLGRWKIFEAIFSIPFRLKGRVLRNATATVHSIRAIPKPEAKRDHADEQSDKDDDEPAENEDTVERDYYEMEATIFPETTKGPFHFWEPGEIVLSPNSRAMSDDGACEIIEMQVINDPTLEEQRRQMAGIQPEVLPDKTESVADADEVDDVDENEFCKFFGPQRLLYRFGVKRGVKKLKFHYYFERFGSIVIPS